MKYRVYETERLKIVPTTEDHAEFILALMNTPKFHQYIGDRNVKTLEDAKQYIKTRMLTQLAKLGYSNYTVIRKKDRQKIGTCGLYDREGLDGIDIGFAFLPEHEKKGFAFEAASRIRDAAFEDFGIMELSAITVKENLPSQKLLEKLGFAFKGITKLTNSDEELLLFKIEK